MRSPALLLSSSLAPALAVLRGSHSSGFCSLLSILLSFLFLPTTIFAQSDTIAIKKEMNDTTAYVPIHTMSFVIPTSDKNYYLLTPEQKKKRIWFIAGSNVVGYGGAMVALYSAWYKNYPQTNFHTFNDFPEWKQVDKVG